MDIYLGRTHSALCPVAAVLNYLAIHPLGEGPLFVRKESTPLTRESFVKGVRAALATANIDSKGYSGHSFRIGAATAAAGVPVHTMKMLGRWTSDAYLLYVRTPRETLASCHSASPSDNCVNSGACPPGPPIYAAAH